MMLRSNEILATVRDSIVERAKVRSDCSDNSFRCDLPRLFTEGASLIKEEFAHAANEAIYRLAFSRLTLPDPYEFLIDPPETPVIMLGTDQRDLLVDHLKRLGRGLPQKASMLDLGCGDGSTSELVFKHAPRSVHLDVRDINVPYLEAYVARLLSRGFPASSYTASRQSLDEFARGESSADSARHDLILVLHALYFAENVSAFLSTCVEALRPGGRLVLIFADENDGLTGRLSERWVSRRGLPRNYQLSVARRHNLFSLTSDRLDPHRTTQSVQNVLGRSDVYCTIVERLPSRIYGISARDLIATGFITNLLQTGDRAESEKVDFVAAELSHNPVDYDLRVERAGRRRGMLSVSQPQFVVVLERGL